MIKYSMHNSVTKRFCDNKFHIFLRDIQLLRNIWQIDVWISKGDLSEADTNDDLIEAKDQSIKSILLVGWLVMLNKAIKAVQLAFQNYLNQFVVRIDMCKHEAIRKNLSIGNLPQ